MKRREGLNRNFHRRAFLSGLGLAGLYPFIPILNASGQEATFPKRLVLFFTPHGTLFDAWLPTGTETNFTLGTILQSLQPFQRKLNILAGVSMHDAGVGAPHTKGLPLLWTGSPLLQDMTFREDGKGFYFGWNSSASVDQVIANRIGSATVYPTLEFGVRSQAAVPGTRMIYTGPKQPKDPMTDPAAALTRLFAGHTDVAGLERKSALDLIQAELGELGTRVAKEDQMKVQAHLAAIRTSEMRIAQSSTRCNGPVLGKQVDPLPEANTPSVYQSQMDLMVSALACDMTRIASMQYTVGDIDQTVYSWLGRPLALGRQRRGKQSQAPQDLHLVRAAICLPARQTRLDPRRQRNVPRQLPRCVGERGWQAQQPLARADSLHHRRCGRRRGQDGALPHVLDRPSSHGRNVTSRIPGLLLS